MRAAHPNLGDQVTSPFVSTMLFAIPIETKGEQAPQLEVIIPIDFVLCLIMMRNYDFTIVIHEDPRNRVYTNTNYGMVVFDS